MPLSLKKKGARRGAKEMRYFCLATFTVNLECREPDLNRRTPKRRDFKEPFFFWVRRLFFFLKRKGFA